MRVRIWLMRAAVLLAAGEWRSASNAGMLACAEVSACGPVIVASVDPGNEGQVDGAVSPGVPEAASAIIPIAIAQ
jgi:hypothetical protein